MALGTVGAHAEYALKLAYAECSNGYIVMSLTSPHNYPLPGEEPYPAHLRTLEQFASEPALECEADDSKFVVETVRYFPARVSGMCGAQDTAKFRLAELQNGVVVTEVWLDRSHGWDCVNSRLVDRQVRLGRDIFAICNKPNDPDRDPTLLDMTGYDCVQLKERN